MTTPDTAPVYADIVAARRRIKGLAHVTPVVTCQSIDAMLGCQVFFKCENLQKIGAFKFRGALNALGVLTDSGYAGAVATHSSGNHGAALSLAAKQYALAAHIVMPENSSQAKFAAVETYGGHVTTCGTSIEDRDRMLRTVVEQTKAHVIHPFDDRHVIAGQGSAACELLESVTDLDVIMTPIGGGGLISGTAIATRAIRPTAKIIGVEPQGADVAFRSFKTGALTKAPPPQTIADGLRAGLAASTFKIIHQHVDDVFTVTEASIVAAMRTIWQRTKLIVEPSSAVPLAALLSKQVTFPRRRVGIILTGGNVDLDALPWVDASS